MKNGKGLLRARTRPREQIIGISKLHGEENELLNAKVRIPLGFPIPLRGNVLTPGTIVKVGIHRPATGARPSRRQTDTF
jgi:hypothetical protein